MRFQEVSSDFIRFHHFEPLTFDVRASSSIDGYKVEHVF